MTQDPSHGAATVGIIMLDTRFPRLPGDIGHPDTFGGAVLYHRIPKAAVSRVVRAEGVDPALVDPMISAARDLEARGARVIASSCGYLGQMQDRLQAAVTVPVVSSALTVLPLLRMAHGAGAALGVLTFDACALSPTHFGSAWDPDVLVEGLQESLELYPVIREDRTTLDRATAEADAVAATRRLRAQAGGRLDAVVLECTNLGPYAQAIRAAAGAPVLDLVTVVRWLSSLGPRACPR